MVSNSIVKKWFQIIVGSTHIISQWYPGMWAQSYIWSKVSLTWDYHSNGTWLNVGSTLDLNIGFSPHFAMGKHPLVSLSHGLNA